MNMKSWPGKGRRQRGIALVIVLSFVVLLTVVVVAYFSRVMNSRQLANDSFNGGRTDQLARSAMDVIVNDFKQEIANGSTATTVNGVTTYYPAKADGTLIRANMVPVRSGTSDAIPNLIRRSVQSDPMASPGVASRASKVNSASNASINGRVVSLARWNKHYLIPQADPTGSKSDPVATFTAPDWVMMTKEEGPAVLTTPTQDAAGNTVTPVGRYAYAVYDEGGLLDANVAGFPTGTTLAQSGTKSVLASADLTQVPIKIGASQHPNDYLPQQAVIDQLIGWRNYATAQPTGSFGAFGFAAGNAVQYFTALAANTSGFLKASTNYYQNRTDQTFLSRGQLISFQQSFPSGNPGVFPASALQYLGTFSRELNAPSWGPTQNASDMGGNSNNMTTVTANAVNPPQTSVAYYNNRNTPPYANRFLPGVRFTKAGTVTDYDANAQPYQYTVKIGDPLVQQRFPLNRLTWVGPQGPRNGGTAQSIQAAFGLVWGPSTDPKLNASGTTGVKVWKYCGSTGTTEQGAIETLDLVAGEAREPNFFELLQAGVLSGSLGLLPSELNNYTPIFTLDSDQWTELQIFRIGATIITQAQQPDKTITTNYPAVIEYSRSGAPIVVAGIDDLPYLNTFYAVSGSYTTTSKTPIQVYMVYGLWNPQQSASPGARPNVRLVTEGSVSMINAYGILSNVLIYNFSVPGYTKILNAATTPLLLTNTSGSSTGVNGFADPHILTAQDVQSGLGAGAAGMDWGITPAILGTPYVGYRLPDFPIDPARNPGPYDANYTANPAEWSWMYFYFNTAANYPFNIWLEFQNPDGNWIPYNYFAGVDHSARGIAKTPGFFSSYMGPEKVKSLPYNPTPPVYDTSSTALPLPIDDPADTYAYCEKFPFVNSDPRSARFNYAVTQTTNSRPAGFTFFTASVLSSATEVMTPPSPWGRKVTQGGTAVPLTAIYYGSTLARNNPQSATGSYTVPTSYKDLDGVQRIADGGLYTDYASTDGWQGDPYALANTTNIDRPTVFHRPYTNVGELGYIPRDYPWRTLDFFTANSADAGLLDLFTASANTGPVSAGHINLNTRNLPALNALLSRAGTNFVPSTPTTLTKPTSIAAKLLALTTSSVGTDGPFINKSEIVNRFIAGKLSTGPITATSDFTTLDEQNIKIRREAVTRALAEVGQTRTWNLMVDLIAQSGRYPVNATQAGQLANFNVEGERHYWFHVAIDRFTGEVIDQQLEAVTE